MAEETGKDLGAASRAADKRLREAHLDEYNKYKSEEAKARGIEWSPRLTDEQKAEKQYADLIAKYPHLAGKKQDDEITLDLDS